MPSNGKKTADQDPTTGKFLPGNKCGGRKQKPDWLAGKGLEALKVAYKIMNDEEARPELRLQAAKMLVEYDLGKPRQAVDVEANAFPQVVFNSAETSFLLQS